MFDRPNHKEICDNPQGTYCCVTIIFEHGGGRGGGEGFISFLFTVSVDDFSVPGASLSYPNSTQTLVTLQSDARLPIHLDTGNGPPFIFRTRSALSPGLHLSFQFRVRSGFVQPSNSE